MNTKRLLIREFDPQKDAENTYYLNRDSDVIQYTGDIPFESIEDARNFLEAYSDYRRNGYGRWAVEHLNTSTFLGWCGLKLHEDGMVDLGYRFLKSQWGKGYATEASLACIAYGFDHLGLNEIVGRTAQENTASVKVLEKCGMAFWKIDECKGIEKTNYYRIYKKDFGQSDEELYSLNG